MKAIIRLIIATFLTIVLFSCNSHNYLHRDIKTDNYNSLLKCNMLNKNDSVWLTKKTVCVKMADSYIKVGRLRNGKEEGKWYYYHVLNDTIDCYFIENFRKADTLKNRIKIINPRYL